jgi:hypothetical protein
VGVVLLIRIIGGLKMEEGENMSNSIVLKNKAGKRVPSVTTIVSQLDKPALVYWAHKLGLEGVTDLYGRRDTAKKAGALTHELIETCLRDAEPINFSEINIDDVYSKASTIDYTDEEIELSRPIFERAVNLLKRLSPMQTLLMEHSMVSEKHQFGGRLDWYGVTAGNDSHATLLDIKSGKDIYKETIIQLAAYRGLLLEIGNRVGKVLVVRIGATPDDGEEIKVLTDAELNAAWDVFLHLRAIYDLQNVFKSPARRAAA